MNAALNFINLVSGNESSSVTDTSFTNCMASCVYMKNSHDITFKTNILYETWVFGVQITLPRILIFQDNLIIGVSGRPSVAEGS